MLLGIVLHGSLAYTTAPFWAVHDDRTSKFFDTLFTVIHGFRMPLFFVISGFFTAMLWRKYGLSFVIRQRARRILLPLVIFIVPIAILNIAVFGGIGALEAARNGAKPVADTMWTAARENNIEALKRHLAGGADINERDPQYQIPALNWAALNGSLQAAEWLIQSGALVDATSSDDSTALSHAAFTGRADIAALLIGHGADVNSVNRHQSTPLDNAQADWEVLKWVAGTLRLKVDQQQAETGHKAVIALLREKGGMRLGELDSAKNGAGAAGKRKPRAKPDFGTITKAYLDFTKLPLFNQLPIFGHLWFLWFLCLLLVPFSLWAWIGRRYQWGKASARLLLSPLLLLWLVPATAILQWFHGLLAPGFGPDTSAGIFVPPHILLLYALYFFFGAFYFDCDDREGRLGRRGWLMLPIALFAVYPLGMDLTFQPDSEWIIRCLPPRAVRPLAVLMQALFAWLMIFGLIGLFRKVFASESKSARYLSDSAYFLYLMHLPLIFIPQYLMKQVDLPAGVKFTVVCVSITAVLLLIYELGVRYTFIGTLLNGKRTRIARIKASVLLVALGTLLCPSHPLHAGETTTGTASAPSAIGHSAFLSPHASPIAVSGGRVFVVNTPAGTVDVIDAGSRTVVARVNVGIDPVGIAVRPDGKEVWVANHVSDSVSVIDIDPASPTHLQVIATVQDFNPATKATRFDEPVGVAFASNEKAYVALSSENQIAVINVATRQVDKRLEIAAQDPRAIVVRGDRLYVIPFESNNKTRLSSSTKIDGDLVTFDAWEHSIKNNNVLSLGHVVDIVKHPKVPDRELFVFDIATDKLVGTVHTLGTLLYGLAVDSQGRVFIAQTDARNDVNGRAGTRKHSLAELEGRAFLNRITRVDFNATERTPAFFDLEPLPPQHPAPGMALATPFAIQISDDDSTLVVSAAGSDKLFTVDAASGEVLGRVTVGAVPEGIALESGAGGKPSRAWVLNAVANTVSVVDVSAPHEPEGRRDHCAPGPHAPRCEARAHRL